MQHGLHIWDIEPPGRDICGDEDASLPFLFLLAGSRKPLHGPQSRFLRHLAMQRMCGEVQVLEERDKAADGIDAVCEDEDAGGGEVA